ncbi:outer membrane receptor protein involved in Fe transport [Flavobacterium croceum DSM 17960]|uniref:Outer membrane receptor protein involved in Fe transport n=1 Tax=Flavobacterium croceum DSM 17960 TaxID=1121886 RepID=A0A2S4N710_9FLAO|nr:carboxypeptidase-like regulatory domain-containing protein [Flavobacterium croceum]POS01502.1 outer membrane receptor protein involved in Fe transport [Flavobacterium croceum DSM 17960]
MQYFFKKSKLLFLLLFIYNLHIAQNINGTIKNTDGIGIENASVSIWNSEKKESLFGYTYSDQKGVFSFKTNQDFVKVFIEISCINYETKSQLVALSNNNVDFVLQRKEFILDEVKIINENAVKVKNDSVFYDPKKFLNGSERKVEDLLKKLPGIKVDEITGQIKYKGKNVETVKLEGDDLFGSNYTIGTKNISVDMVEQVQAIENYSPNELLKGIEDSDRVVLNLKLKKNKTDFSGSSSINNGYGKKLMLADDATVLGISKKIKSFGVISYYNFGINPFNNQPNYDETLNTRFGNEESTTKTNIIEGNIDNRLPSKRTTYNNNFNINYNIITKISSKISLKNNLFFFKDDVERQEKIVTNYFTNNNAIIENSSENNIYKSPKYYRFDTKVIYNISNNSLLQSEISFKNQITNSNETTIQNNLNQFNSNLKTIDFFVKAKLEYTIRLNNKNALQFSSNFSRNKIPQELQIVSNNIIFEGINTNNCLQNSSFNKQILSTKLSYLNNNGKIKKSVTIGNTNTYLPFQSSLIADGNNINSFYENSTYRKSTFFSEYSTMFNYKKIKIQPFFNVAYINQQLKNDAFNKLALNQSILITYRINKRLSLFGLEESEEKTPTEEYLFTNSIVINNQTLKNNISNLNLIKSENLTFGIKYENLTKQFLTKLSFQYLGSYNNYIANININQNFVSYTYFQNPNNLKSRQIIFDGEKQIKALRLSFKHSSTFSFNNYYNSIDNFQIRNNSSFNYNGNLFILSYFNIPINFENLVNYSINKYKTNEVKSERRLISNNFKLIIKPFKQWNLAISQDYYIIDLKSKQNFSFIDFNLQYKSQKVKGLFFSIYGRNLKNTSVYSQTNNSDYAFTYYQSQLLPRYFMLSMELEF